MKLVNRSPFFSINLRLLILCLLFLVIAANSFAQVDYIVAKVNNSAITYSELKSRIRLFTKISGFKNDSKKDEKILLDAILSKIIEEELIFQDAKKLGIKVSKDELNHAIKIITLSQKDNFDDLANFLKHNQLQYESFAKQVESEVLWSKIISSKLKSTISVSELEINEMLNRSGLLKEKIQLNVSEISINVNNSNIVNKIYQELLLGANFQQVAKNFSESYSSEDKGNLGWVDKSQLNKSIFDELLKVKKGGYSKPILLGDYYRIFKINDIKTDKDFNEEDFKRVEEYLYNNKLRIKSKSYLMKLKREAFIEIDLIN